MSRLLRSAVPVAALVSDSLDEPDACAEERRLVFAADDVRVHVEVVRRPGRPDLRVSVRVVPSPGPVLGVQSHRPEETAHSAQRASSPGHWLDVRIPPGPTTLHLVLGDREVQTACVRL